MLVPVRLGQIRLVRFGVLFAANYPTAKNPRAIFVTGEKLNLWEMWDPHCVWATFISMPEVKRTV